MGNRIFGDASTSSLTDPLTLFTFGSFADFSLRKVIESLFAARWADSRFSKKALCYEGDWLRRPF